MNAIEIHYHYIILLFTLFIVPKVLQRYRVPTAITSLFIGLICGIGFDLFRSDPTIDLLSMFGIVSLFLFAGLEVEFHTIRSEKKVISQHLVIAFIALVAATLLIHYFFNMEVRPAALVALAILTPSTGFILDSLAAFKMDPEDEFWIKAKAIATELLALGALFIVLQSTTYQKLLISIGVLLSLFIFLPAAFRFFAKLIIPYAPKSEFAFLIMLALVCALVTKELGVYYLVGAFVVGVSAQQFREKFPEITSTKMLSGVELFSSFFIPFYFFHAGLKIERSDMTYQAFMIGFLLLIIMIPIRIGKISLHRRIILNEEFIRRLRIATSMMPTLVFTLVIAGILKDKYDISGSLFGGLIIYSILNTILPSMVLRTPLPNYQEPNIPEVPLSRNSISERAAKNMFSHDEKGS